MAKKHDNIYIFGVGLLSIILNAADFQTLQASADLFENVPGIQIRKENGTTFVINSSHSLSYDPPGLFRNTDLTNKTLDVSTGERIKISYQSPCGIPDSIKGVFVDGKVSVVTVGEYQKLNLEGPQRELYENNLPGGNGTDNVKIPTDLKAEKYILLIIIDCDDSIRYYMSNATINPK